MNLVVREAAFSNVALTVCKYGTGASGRKKEADTEVPKHRSSTVWPVGMAKNRVVKKKRFGKDQKFMNSEKKTFWS